MSRMKDEASSHKKLSLTVNNLYFSFYNSRLQKFTFSCCTHLKSYVHPVLFSIKSLIFDNRHSFVLRLYLESKKKAAKKEVTIDAWCKSLFLLDAS